jgi:hypothetical protein
MPPTREEKATNLAERLCWQVACRDDSRGARRLYRTQSVDGVYRLDDGAWLDDFCDCLHALGGVDWLGHVQGTAVPRARGPVVQYRLLSSLKTVVGIESMHALPARLCSDEARMRLVGFKALPVRQGVCQRGAATRQGPRTGGPIGPDTLADHIVQVNLRDLEAWFNGVIRTLAKTGSFGAQVTGIVAATALETTAQDEGWGHVTRQRRITDKRGQGRASEVPVYGVTLLVLIDARTKMPLAATVVPAHAHAGLSRRAVVTQARTNLAGYGRLHKVVFAKGVLAGAELWWLEQPRILVVVPTKAHMAVTVDAQAQAAAGERVTVGRRAPTVRPGQGNTAWTARLDPEVVGMAGVTTPDQDGTPEHGRPANRRDFQPHPITAVVVRPWTGHAYGPAGKPVFLTTASVQPPLRPCDDDDDRRLSEQCWSKARKPPWSWKPPPPKTARAVRVHVMCTVVMVAWATAYRRPCEQADPGGEPVGWQRWRRQLLEQTRAVVSIVAEDDSGIFHLAADSRRRGVKLHDVPPGIGTHQDILAKYRRAGHG